MPQKFENTVELAIVVVLFLVVTVLGFAASRWRAGQSLMHLDEWGLGGRSFGSWITWFLLGGDLYTAYTFVAVPALMFGAGAAGFFAVPYTVVVYPLVFLVRHPALVGQPRPRLRDAGGLRPGPVRLPDDGAAGGDHRDRRDDALHRAAAGRHRGGAEGDRRQRHGAGAAADHRLPGAGAVHLQVRAAGAGADRVREGRADLPRDHRRGHRHPVEARRLGRRSSARRTRSSPRPSRRRHPARRDRPVGVLDPGARLGAGAVPLPALGHRGAGREQPGRDQAQHGRAAASTAWCSA